MRNLFVAAVLLAAAVPALAATTSVSDPIDAGQSRLDLKTASASATPQAVTMMIRTHRPWSTSVLAKASSKTYACVYLWKPGADTRGNIDFQICANAATGSLKASVYSVDEGDSIETETKVARAGDNGLKWTIPRSLLGPGAKFGWFAGTRDGGSATRDSAPNGAPKSTPLPQS
jgi:hypothetical protein